MTPIGTKCYRNWIEVKGARWSQWQVSWDFAWVRHNSALSVDTAKWMDQLYNVAVF